MTSALEVELTSYVAGTLAADSEDAPVLLAIARLLRQDDELRYEASAAALDGMARRMTERHRAGERMRERGLLDETTSLAIVDLADE